MLNIIFILGVTLVSIVLTLTLFGAFDNDKDNPFKTKKK